MKRVLRMTVFVSCPKEVMIATKRWIRCNGDSFSNNQFEHSLKITLNLWQPHSILRLRLEASGPDK